VNRFRLLVLVLSLQRHSQQTQAAHREIVILTQDPRRSSYASSALTFAVVYSPCCKLEDSVDVATMLME
jgi:hypothetical protein